VSPMKKWILYCAVFALLGLGTFWIITHNFNSSAHQHLQAALLALPPSSPLRETLRAVPDLGQSTFEPWREAMNREHIRIATLRVSGTLRDGKFNPQHTDLVIYRRKYDGPNSQITDANHLVHFKEIGLEHDLEQAAFARSNEAQPLMDDVPHPPHSVRKCFVDVHFLDDPLLADENMSRVAVDGCHPEGQDRPMTAGRALFQAATLADEQTVSKLLSTQQFTQQDLNSALLGAVYFPLDNTDVLSLLIQAGADVNSQASDGTSVLMEAVMFHDLANAKLLIAAGADVNRRNASGMTAYSRAKELGRGLVREPSYIPELLNLLKPHS